MFSVRIKPMSDESLISFMTRFATENGTKMLSIWHDISRNKLINPQKADAHLLERTPEAFIILEDFAEETEVSKGQLIAMTYYHVLEKFCYPSEIPCSRILRGMMRDNLHFCPLCIEEKAYIRRQWKIDGVSCCVKHQISLSQGCSQCGNVIKIMDIDNIEICPYCYFKLKDTPPFIEKLDVEELEKHQLVETIWSQLQYCSGNYRSPSEVATMLLYLLNEEHSIFNRNIVQRNASVLKIHLPYLLQLARNALLRKRALHIRTLLNVMVFCNIDYEYFEKLEVPEIFRDSLRTLKHDIFENIRCIAPWCTYFQRSGSLVKTGTVAKRHSDGSLLRKYVACTACGSRFAFNAKGNMVELEGFLKGYYDLQHMIKENGSMTLLGLRRPVDFNRDRWWGIIAYFCTRPVFGEAEKLDEDLLLAFVQSVEKNGNMNNIHKWKCWDSYRHFLLYRYHSEVMNAQVYSQRKLPMRHSLETCEEMMKALCQEMLENDQDISIERISLLLKVTSNTIRTWGFHHYIKERKNEQGRKRLEARKKLLIDRVDEFFVQNENHRVLSKDIYSYIGIRQSYLNSIAPELNQYISEKRLQYLSIL
ncbi:hypothetical protein JCM16418A_41840 [Paenibacillus pini]|nr:TniQ family protein [Paenibacillus pini]